MKIMSNKNYNRLVNSTKIDTSNDLLPLQLENKDMELKIESIYCQLVDIYNDITGNISKQKLKDKIKSLIDFIEKGKV